MVGTAGSQSEGIVWERGLMVRATGKKNHDLCRGPKRATRIQGRTLGCDLATNLHSDCCFLANALKVGAAEIRLEVRRGQPDLSELSRSLFGIHKAIGAVPSETCLEALGLVAHKDAAEIGKLAMALSVDLAHRREAIKRDAVDLLELLDKSMLAKHLANKMTEQDHDEIKIALRLVARWLERTASQIMRQEVKAAERLRREMRGIWQADRKFLQKRSC